MSAAADYWEEMAEAEILANGGRGIYLSELRSKCHDCSATYTGGYYYCAKHRAPRAQRRRQLRANGATSGPMASSGSKEGRGQL